MDSSRQKIKFTADQQHQLLNFLSIKKPSLVFAGVDGGSVWAQRIGKLVRYGVRVFVMQSNRQVPYRVIVLDKRSGSGSVNFDKLENFNPDF